MSVGNYVGICAVESECEYYLVWTRYCLIIIQLLTEQVISCGSLFCTYARKYSEFMSGLDGLRFSQIYDLNSYLFS